jgi:hypothetical protein
MPYSVVLTNSGAWRAEQFELRLDKCKALWTGAAPVPAGFVHHCHSRNMAQFVGSMEVLGSQVGRDRTQISNWVRASVQDHARFFQALTNEHMPAQVAYQLLRVCGIPRLNYLSRTIHHEAARTGFAEFDRMVAATFGRLIDTNIATEAIARQVILPLRLGGFGLTSYLASREPAFFAALCQSMHVSQSVRQRYYLAGPTIDQLPWYADLQPLRLKLRTLGVPASEHVPMLPVDLVAKFSSNPPSDLQSFILRYLHAQAFLAMQRRSPQSAARMLSASHPASKRWLSVTPSSRDLWLSNTQFSIAARNLLDVSFCSHLLCRCGANLAAPFTSHFHSCLWLRRREVTGRHDMLVHALARLARYVGYLVTVEPRPLHGHSIRPDLKLVGSSGTPILVDVSVVHPVSATSLRSGSSQRRGTAVAARERQKGSKYNTFAARENSQFTGFCLESYGAFGQQAVNLLKLLATEGANNGIVIRKSEFVSHARSAISIALQRGNALVVSGGLRLNNG